MNVYEQKVALRKARLEERAEKLEAAAGAAYKSGMSRLEAIPFGQPILVGHHSEKRDRNYRRKAVAAIDKGIALHKEANEAARRAAAVGSGGVSSDDPEAVKKLTAQLTGLEAHHARMIETNKELRRKAGSSWKEARRQGIGHANWEISNNAANIRRIKARIAQLTRDAERETKETECVGGIRIVENAEMNRVQLFFPGKPAAEVRDKLKAYGFRWSPSEGAWQRHLGSSAIYWAHELVKSL